jgi:hypothetical protein
MRRLSRVRDVKLDVVDGLQIKGIRRHCRASLRCIGYVRLWIIPRERRVSSKNTHFDGASDKNNTFFRLAMNTLAHKSYNVIRLMADK